MLVSTVKQGSVEWRAARCGVVTASNFRAVLTGGSGRTRETYLMRLAQEIITGQVLDPSFHSAAMARGTDLEPHARKAYAQRTGCAVHEVGLVWLDTARRVAASPDGLIDEDGGLEIKCPLPGTHEKYLCAGTLPALYVAQVQGNLWVTGRKWWDFVSFAPEFPERNRMMVCRVHRDEAYIDTLRTQVLRFLGDLDRVTSARTRQRA